MWSFRLSFSCSCGIFLFWICFFTQKLRCSIGLTKHAFFSRIFYGAPLPDWDKGFRGLLVEVVKLHWKMTAGYSVVFLSFFIFNLTGSQEIKSCHCTVIPCQPRLDYHNVCNTCDCRSCREYYCMLDYNCLSWHEVRALFCIISIALLSYIF